MLLEDLELAIELSDATASTEGDADGTGDSLAQCSAPDVAVHRPRSYDESSAMDKLDARRRSDNMRRIGSRDTSPELAVRSCLHRLGFRFRLHRKDLPGSPDIVLPSRHTAIFVHGCFWHQHEGCRDGRVPSSRKEYWEPKLSRNTARDTASVQRLEALGWSVLTVWECETSDMAAVADRLSRALRKRAPA